MGPYPWDSFIHRLLSSPFPVIWGELQAAGGVSPGPGSLTWLVVNPQ